MIRDTTRRYEIRVGSTVRVVGYGYGARLEDCGEVTTVTKLNRTRAVLDGIDQPISGECLQVIFEVGDVAGRVRCHECDELHVAEYHHDGRFGEGPVFAVVCPVDQLTDFYTTEGLEP